MDGKTCLTSYDDQNRRILKKNETETVVEWKI